MTTRDEQLDAAEEIDSDSSDGDEQAPHVCQLRCETCNAVYVLPPRIKFLESFVLPFNLVASQFCVCSG